MRWHSYLAGLATGPLLWACFSRDTPLAFWNWVDEDMDETRGLRVSCCLHISRCRHRLACLAAHRQLAATASSPSSPSKKRRW